MIWTAFCQDSLHGINSRIHRCHHFFMPLVEIINRLLADIAVFTGEIELFVGVIFEIKEHLFGEQVEPIVVGADVNPLVKPDRSLADMGTLTENEIIPST